jgi:p-hydroxybenzoate 3-monooxygenase
VRAGVIEQVTMDLLDEVGVGERMHADGLIHEGVQICLFGSGRELARHFRRSAAR